MSISQERKYELKIKAAYYYYKKNMKLSDIADTLKISRVTLSRLMKDIVDEGIVKIEIVDRNSAIALLELEESVKKRFGLKEVCIVNTLPNGASYITNNIAMAAAQLVDSMIKSGMRISITWGKTLEMLVTYLKGNSYIKNIKVYTLLGSTGIIDMQMQPNTIAYNILQKYSGTGRVMNVPFICETKEACDIIMAEKNIASIVEESKDSDLTLVGIGPTPNETASRDKMRYEVDILKELRKHNVCGDIGSNFYDIYGNICEADICKRFVKVDISDIKKHKCVMGIAGGEHKVSSILGALNGNYLDILVTDKDTIVDVMEMADRLGM